MRSKALDHHRLSAALRVGSRPHQLIKNIWIPPWFTWLVADIAEHPVWDRCRPGYVAACPVGGTTALVHRSA
jgi:hypothetical protein